MSLKKRLHQLLKISISSDDSTEEYAPQRSSALAGYMCFHAMGPASLDSLQILLFLS